MVKRVLTKPYIYDGRINFLRRRYVNQAVPKSRLLFHSDRGIHYACRTFTGLLAARQITQSMSRKGNWWDNVPAESFFKALKAQLQIDRPFTSYEEARKPIFAFIELWYNRKRLHSALDYQTPIQAEQQLTIN